MTLNGDGIELDGELMVQVQQQKIAELMQQVVRLEAAVAQLVRRVQIENHEPAGTA